MSSNFLKYKSSPWKISYLKVLIALAKTYIVMSLIRILEKNVLLNVFVSKVLFREQDCTYECSYISYFGNGIIDRKYVWERTTFKCRGIRYASHWNPKLCENYTISITYSNLIKLSIRTDKFIRREPEDPMGIIVKWLEAIPHYSATITMTMIC